MSARRTTLLALFVATIYAANWTLETYGLVEIPIIGWMAPAGVLWAGFAFGVRDALHEAGGIQWRRWVLGAIALGTALSYWLGAGVTIPGGKVSIALASGIAFAISELADLSIYAPLRERRWKLAVTLSNLAGAVVDSLIFLYLAFGSVDDTGGQVLAKAVMILPAFVLVGWVRSRAVSRHRIGTEGA